MTTTGWHKVEGQDFFRHTPSGRVVRIPPMEKVMIRSRLAHAQSFGEPWDATRDEKPFIGMTPGFISMDDIPEEGSQLISPDDRAFSVMLVERRYDLGETHLYCVEHPRQDPPVSENKA